MHAVECDHYVFSFFYFLTDSPNGGQNNLSASPGPALGLNNIDAPIYIKELLVPLNSTRALRSSTKNLLKVPKLRTKTYGDRAFSVIGPVLWNKLPDELRHELSLNSFKSKLKTFLFRHFYE